MWQELADSRIEVGGLMDKLKEIKQRYCSGDMMRFTYSTGEMLNTIEWLTAEVERLRLCETEYKFLRTAFFQRGEEIEQLQQRLAEMTNTSDMWQGQFEAEHQENERLRRLIRVQESEPPPFDPADEQTTEMAVRLAELQWQLSALREAVQWVVEVGWDDQWECLTAEQKHYLNLLRAALKETE